MTNFNLSEQADKKYTIEDLLAVIERLMAPDGCPWDRAQTHHSLRQNMIEEAYETVDAIDSQIPSRLKDELGDVLLQVLIHGAIAQKNQEFDFTDITDNLSRKLIYRHSHVFGTDQAKDPEQVLDLWGKNKMQEKGQTTVTQTMKDLPAGLSALMQSDKLQKRAAKVGFDWPDASGALGKIEEELKEVEAALAEHGKPLYGKLQVQAEPEVFSQVEEELGDVLFAVVNYVRLLGVNPEVALNRSNQKFVQRFEAVEKLAQSSDRLMTDMSLEELDQIWDQVKAEQNQNI